MSGPGQDDLRELIDSLYDPDDAARVSEDLREGLRILHNNPAPKPRPEVLAKIKVRLAAEVHTRHRHVIFRRLEYVAAAAAAVIVVASIVMGPSQKHTPMPNTASIIPTAFWESDDVSTVDPKLANIKTEIDQIQDEMTVIDSGDNENTNAGENTVSEIEMELIQLEGEFWKG